MERGLSIYASQASVHGLMIYRLAWNFGVAIAGSMSVGKKGSRETTAQNQGIPGNCLI